MRRPTSAISGTEGCRHPSPCTGPARLHRQHDRPRSGLRSARLRHGTTLVVGHQSAGGKLRRDGGITSRPDPDQIRVATRVQADTSTARSGASRGRRRRRDSAGIPDDFPEMAVRVSEISGVDSPRAVMRFRGRRARSFGLAEELVDLCSGADELPETELAALLWPEVDFSVFGEVAACVEAEDQAALEL